MKKQRLNKAQKRFNKFIMSLKRKDKCGLCTKTIASFYLCNSKDTRCHIMLGKVVKVKIDQTKKGYVSKIGTSVYHGSLIEEHPDNHIKSVYLMLKKDPIDSFEGAVIGIINKNEKTDQHLIVAPIGYVYYEPEIRDLLSKTKKQPIHSIHCRYEKSCGAVIFNGDMENLRVLLVKNKNANHWGFPKGHVEKGETEHQTAIREIKEETGLKVNIIKGFREVSDYYSSGCTKKRVVFFVAKSKSWNIHLQLEELDSYMWATYDKALKMFEFKNNVMILKNAINFINQKSVNKFYAPQRLEKI